MNRREDMKPHEERTRSPADMIRRPGAGHLADHESGHRTAADRGPAHHEQRRAGHTPPQTLRAGPTPSLAHDPRQRETAQKGPEIREQRMYRTHCPHTAGSTQKPQDARREPHPVKP